MLYNLQNFEDSGAWILFRIEHLEASSACTHTQNPTDISMPKVWIPGSFKSM